MAGVEPEKRLLLETAKNEVKPAFLRNVIGSMAVSVVTPGDGQ
jgi:hypothetical protein